VSISIDGYSPVYHPTPALPEPQTEHDNSAADALAALQEAIAAAKRALEAARKAEAEAKKAQEALDQANEANKQALQSDFDAKKVTAEQKWDDLKVATKEAYAAGGPEGQEKVTTQLKAIDSKDGDWAKQVDAAKAEKPDLAILASGNKDTDAAAKRVSNAYASGGEAGATKQLRTELESAKTPEDRRAILRSAMPVVDKVTKDLGANARRTEGDWEEKARTNGKDADKTGPIDTRSEFDHTVADLEASVELAGDKEAAFHIAHDILQVMPGGDRANSANNLLGLLGLDLGQSSPNKTSMLETAMSAALVQPDAQGDKDSMLAMPLAQRDQIARLLAPDRPTTVTIRDWTDDRGVKHGGTLWHEVEQNPDLLLSAQQRADIDKKTKGLSAGDVLKEKTGQAIENLRKQNPDKNVDNAKIGDTFNYKAEDPRKDVPEPLAKDVQTAVDKSRGGHQDDLQYGVDLDKLTNSDAFRQLGADQQVEAVGQFDRTLTQSTRADGSGTGATGLGDDQKNQLRELITSSNFHDVNSRVQNRVLGLFSELAKTDSCDTSALKRLVDHPGFRTLDTEAGELQVLESYQHDSTYRTVVDKLVGTDLPAADARTSLDALTGVQANRQLYDKSNDGDKQKILNSVLQATTDPRFRGFAQNQKDAAIDKLVKYGDEQYALDGSQGVDTALKEAAEVKPSAAAPVATDKPASQQPSTQAGPPTAVSVKADLAKIEAGAHDVATSKETINDPLRKYAGEDPVTYAYLKAQAERQGDKTYLKLLDEALPQHRREVTTQQVKDLNANGKSDEALKLLNTQLDATKDPAERKQLWEAAGQPVFTRAYFDQQIDKALNGHGLPLEDLSKQFNQVGENAPPEVANLMLDAIKAHTDKGSDDPLWKMMMEDTSAQAGTYEGLSLLVERADSLGGNRADEVAQFYVDGFDKVSRERGLAPGAALMLTGGPEGGLRLKISEAISDHGAARLSVALYNAAKKHAPGPDLGGGRDWTDTIETKTRNGIRDGLSDFHNNVKGDVEDWQKQNKNALRLVQDFGGSDPEGVARAMAQQRKEHPDTYYKVDDEGKADGVDVAYAKMEQRGVQTDALMRDLIGIDLDFNHPKVPAEKQLGDEIQSLDKDPLVLSTLKNNLALDEHRADQLNFGHFDPANSPFSPLLVVKTQRDHLDKLVRDNGISPELATQLNQRTDRWENDLNAALSQGDKVDNAKLQSLTDDYHKDLKGLLKDKVADGGEGALVQPPAKVVEEIKTDWQSIGTTTSTLRLTMNWYRDTGDNLLRAYTQVAFRRAANGQARFNDGDLVRNAARFGLSDEKTINKMEKFMHDMQGDIDAKLKKSGQAKLTPAEYNEVMEKFKGQAADYGPVKPFDPHADPGVMKTSERVTRGLGMLCYFGSAVNNGINASNEPGLSSSDAFAALFGTGAVVEAYRTIKGKDMQGGKLQELLDNGKRTPEKADELAKFLKSNAVGGLVALADVAWAFEDFSGYSVGGHKNGEGDPIAGWLTTGVVAGDFLELGAASWRARLAATAMVEGAAAAGSTAAPLVGWVAAGIQAVFIGARFAYGVTKAKNEFEFEDNHDYADMVKSLGFTDDQARELMNQSGGNSDAKFDWKSFGDSTPFTLAYGELESFFQEGGMGPMHVLEPLFDVNQVPQEQRLQYLQSLSSDDIKHLVGQTHRILDDEMDDKGKISDASLKELKGWMGENKLWKPEYLGTS